MAHVGEELALGFRGIFSLEAGNFEVTLINQKLLLRFTAFDEKTDLAADRIEEFKNVGIRFADLRTEELDHTHYAASASNGKAECAVQSFAQRHWCARKVVFL